MGSRAATQVVWSFDRDTSGTLPLRGVPDMSIWAKVGGIIYLGWPGSVFGSRRKGWKALW